MRLFIKTMMILQIFQLMRSFVFILLLFVQHYQTYHDPPREQFTSNKVGVATPRVLVCVYIMADDSYGRHVILHNTA